MEATLSQHQSSQWPLHLTCPSFPSKLVIVLIGLPARGKSYIARKLQRYLQFVGFSCKIFNAGKYRRDTLGSGQTASFYDPANTECRKQKRAIAMMCLEDLLKWLEQDNHDVGIFDATNSTRERRNAIYERCREQKAKVLFLESICTDQEILRANYALKLQNDDYKTMNPEDARKDFEARVRAYEGLYETLDDSETHLSFIKLINVGAQIVTNGCTGYMLSQITSFLPNLHITPKTIYFSRHGESQDNVAGKLGGNSGLTEKGQAFAERLHDFIMRQKHPELTVWTSTLDRSIATSLPFKDDKSVTVYQTRLLNEIDAGSCEGMTYQDIKEHHPGTFLARKANKVGYRYGKGGESYIDVQERVKPLILELERLKSPILVIAHRAVLRTIFAYFYEKPLCQTVNLDIPLHEVTQMTITAYGCDIQKVDLGKDKIDTISTLNV